MRHGRIFTMSMAALLLCSSVVAQDSEPIDDQSTSIPEHQVAGFDAVDPAAKLEATRSSMCGRPRSVEYQPGSIPYSEFEELRALGKLTMVDPQTGQVLFKHIKDYLPEGWGKYRDQLTDVDSLGDPIVNRVPGLPGWTQRNVDSLRADISRWRDELGTLEGSDRLEVEGILGDYIGQALVRGIDIADLIDLADPTSVSDGVTRAVIEQVGFYENLKHLRASDGGYVYETSHYDDSVIAFIEAQGLTLDEVLTVDARAIDPGPESTPSGCYTMETFPRGMTNLTGATIIWQASGDDDASADVPIGFRHYFYSCDDPDANINVRVSTNGYISFFEQGGGSLDGTDFTNDPITSAVDPDGYAAPSWDDYIVEVSQGSPDTVSYLTEGATGERVFTVEWVSISRLGGDTDDWHSFQVKLFEATGNVELHASNGWNADSLDSSTVGMEDFDGADGDCGPNCLNSNDTADILNNYRFVPNRPPNDTFHGWLCVGADTQLMADNFGATGTDISSCAFNDFKDTWIFYHAPLDGDVTFDTCSEISMDTTLAVFDDRFGEIGCNDDSCGLQSSVTRVLEGEFNYLIRLAGYNGAEGNYTLSAFPSHGTPSGDLCSNARVIGDTFLGFTSNNSGCVDESTCAFRDTIDEWFAWTSPVNGIAAATTCFPNTTFDTTLAVFDACGGTVLACNDDDPSCPTSTLRSTIRWPVVQGRDYYIRIAGYGFTFGDYRLFVTAGDTGETIFSDGFESGDTSAWSSSVP